MLLATMSGLLSSMKWKAVAQDLWESSYNKRLDKGLYTRAEAL